MKSRTEFLAICAALVIVIGLPAGVLAMRGADSARDDGIRLIDLVARAPERGGWAPDLIQISRGETVRLRITSEDVTHGFAIGRMGVNVRAIYPGEFVQVEFTATEAGRFTFYCDAWCSPFHNRMRGSLMVVDPDYPEDLLTSQIGQAEMPVAGAIDVDSPHPAEHFPDKRPSAKRGERLYADLYDSALLDNAQRTALRSQSPSAVFQMLRQTSEPFSMSPGRPLTEDDTWDVVAYLWWSTTMPQRLDQGKIQYDRNCAACHGLGGSGGKVDLRALDEPPGDLSGAETMMGASSQLLVAKARRGGMGTGMPAWGAIFSEAELVNITDYIWSFVFSYDAR